jgi:hypothetical protein
MSTASRTLHLQSQLWKWSIIIFTSVLLVTSYRIHQSKVKYYDKAKESRRGSIRKAREGRADLHLKQERFGVTRSIWLQDNFKLRRQFFLEADSAEGGASLSGKTSSFQETYANPKGWLQEELFWELRGERVVPDGERWVKESSPNSVISEKDYIKIIPMQHLRFFDAKTAEWDPETNRLVANSAYFCVLKLEGHELPQTLDMTKAVAKGTARSIHFAFDNKGKQHVSCQGVQLQLSKGMPQI